MAECNGALRSAPFRDPVAPVVARLVVMGCVTGGPCDHRGCLKAKPPVTHPMTTSRATTGPKEVLRETLRGGSE
jgi:hypothetical protein